MDDVLDHAGRRSASRACVCAFVGALCLCGAVLAADMPEAFYTLDTSVETPHIAWAKPCWLARPLRVLVLAPRWNQRDSVELMQRMDAECDAVFFYQPGHMWLDGRDWGLEGAEGNLRAGVLARLRAALAREHDVIVISAMGTAQAPPDVLDAIEAKVRGGAGLVYVYGGVPLDPAGRRLYDESYSLSFSQRFMEEAVCKVDDTTLPEVGDAALGRASGADEGPAVALEEPTDLPSEKARLLEGLPLQAMPALGLSTTDLPASVNDKIRLYRCGEGRVVFLKYWDSAVQGGKVAGGCLVPDPGTDLEYEWEMAFLTRVLLWSVGAEAPARFIGCPFELTGDVLDLAVVAAVGADTGGLEATLSVRSPARLQRAPTAPVVENGRQWAADGLLPLYSETKAVRASPDNTRVSFTLPKLPAGEYWVDVQLRRNGLGVDWAVCRRTVKRRVEIAEVDCEPHVIDVRRAAPQAVTVTAVLRGRSSEAVTLGLTLYDNYQRVLSRKQVRVPAGSKRVETQIAIDGLADIRSSLLVLRCALQDADGELSVRCADLTTVGRTYPFFTLSAWAGPGRTRNSRHFFREFARLGFDMIRGGGNLDVLKVADVRFYGGFMTMNRHSTAARQVYYGDPAWREQARAMVARAVAASGDFDHFAFILGGDEPDFPLSMAGPFYAYRAYLRNVYGTVEGLNASWGTDHRSFDEVSEAMYSGDRAGELSVEARRTGNFAPVIDWGMFRYWMVADMFKLVKTTLNEHAPEARLCVTTLMWNHPFRGYFFPEVLKHVDFFSPYLSGCGGGDVTTTEAGRSFMRPGSVHGVLSGSYYSTMTGNPAYYAAFPHAVLMDGHRDFFWYAFGSGGGEVGLSPSMSPYPQTVDAVRELQWMRRGAAELVLKAKRKAPEVAIFYSQPSYIFSYRGLGGSHVPWRQNGWIHCLRNLGYGTRFVSGEQIDAGALADARVLVLPHSQCISDANVEAMRAFVERGGVVLADRRPGIADEHGRTRDENPLEVVFGVTWDKPLAVMESIGDLRLEKDVEIQLMRPVAGTFNGVAFAPPGPESAWQGASWDPSMHVAGGTPALTLGELLDGDAIGAYRRELARARKQAAERVDEAKQEAESKIDGILRELDRLEGPGPRSEGAALLVRHAYGRGQAVLINSSPQQRYLLAAVFESMGIRPIVTFTGAAGNGTPGSYCTGFGCDRFDDGDSRYYAYAALDKAVASPHAIRTALGGGRHVYDMRQGKYLGLRSETEDTFADCWAAWYAVLPYRVERLEATLDGEPVPGRAIEGHVTVSVSGGKPGRHVVNLQVMKGETSIPYLMQNIELSQGTGAFRIPTALNDPVAAWRLRFTDVASGVTAERGVDR